MQDVLQALAEPRRLEILRLIRGRELAAGEIARRFNVTRPAISQHLRVLMKAGLLTETRVATRRLYRIRPEGLTQLRLFLDSFWDEKLAHLKSTVEKQGKPRRGRRR